MEVKNGRLLPSAQFEWTDNGVVLSILDISSGQLIKKQFFEDLVDGLKEYKKINTEYAKELAKVESKTEEKNDLE